MSGYRESRLAGQPKGDATEGVAAAGASGPASSADLSRVEARSGEWLQRPGSSSGPTAARQGAESHAERSDTTGGGESGGPTAALPPGPEDGGRLGDGSEATGFIVVAPPTVVGDLTLPCPDERGQPEVIDGVYVEAVPATLRPLASTLACGRYWRAGSGWSW